MFTIDGAEARESLATRMRLGEVCLGLLLKMPAPFLAELAGYVGFDFLLIDMEHGPDDHTELEHHIRAADAAGIPTIVRVGVLEGALIGRVLDSGAAGIVVPHLGSADDARRAVRAAHYPPVGKRGLAMSTRAGRQTTRSALEHLTASAKDTIVIGQIEDIDAVPHAPEIVSTDLLTSVWIGPNDLSQSIGKPRDHPDFLDAESKIVDALALSPATALAVLADGVDDARRWIEDRGATVVIFSAPNLIAGNLSGLVQSMSGLSGPAVARGHGSRAPHAL